MIAQWRARFRGCVDRYVVRLLVVLGLAVGLLTDRGFRAYRNWMIRRASVDDECGCANRAAHVAKWLEDVQQHSD